MTKTNLIILVGTCIFMPFVMPFVFSPSKYGLFFGWEIGTILQTFWAFRRFAYDVPPPHISSKKHLTYTLLILSPIIMSLFIYFLIKTDLLKYLLPAGFTFSGMNFIMSLFKDSITLVPMVVFFFFNVIFYFGIKKKLRDLPADDLAEYANVLERVMWTVDIPCIVPYVMVIIFAYQYADIDGFKWESYLSGAGSLLLMVSNLLTLSINVPSKVFRQT